MRFILALLLFTPAATAFAQTQAPAPIERQAPAEQAPVLPSAPSPQYPAAGTSAGADLQWQRLMRQAHYLRPEVRIQAEGEAIRCDIDHITPDEIFCTEHRANNGFYSGLILPRAEYHVPRREIRDVREGGREQSTFLGLGIGAAAGVAVGSINQQSRDNGGQLIFALFLGGLGALIGHALPAAGHPVYQAP